MQTRIFFPVAALAALTLAVLLLILYRRVTAALGGRLVPNDFKLGESAQVPDDVRLPNRNLINLFEVPVLFYVVCLSLHATQTVDAVALGLAWAYVALRIAHSAVHLSYNNVMHRLAAYATSNVVLAVMWLRFVLALPA